MGKFKKIIFLLVIVALILGACFRIDRIPKSQTEPLTINGLQYSQQSEYKVPRTLFLNGVDYKLSRSEIGKYGGQIITSTIGEGPKTFNPWVSKDATSSQIGEILYASLLSTDPITGEVIPELAKEYKVFPNKKTMTITLRRGLKWSDGKEITADDVVFTWNEIILAGFGNTSLRDSVLIDGEYPKITKVDKYTTKFEIKKPFAPFLRFMGTQVAPKHVFEPVIKKGKRYFDSYLGTTTKPKDIVYSGAFGLEEYVPAQRVVFKRNPNYYVIDENKNLLPYIDKLVILIVGDLNNELLKFEANELDIISVRGKDLPRFKEKEREKLSNFKIYNLGPNTGTLFVAINLNTRKDKDGKYYVNPIKQKWFNDIKFRTAIDYALDRAGMVYNVANGVGQPLFTAESLSSIYLNEKLASGHEANLEYSKQLLKEAGFYLDKNGILHDKEGNIVEFDLYTNAGQTEREACGVMIKEDLKQLGINLNFKPIEFNSLVSKTMTTFDWDMILLGLTGSPLEPHSGQNVWKSNGHLHLFNMRLNGEKDLLPWEKELNEIFEKGALEVSFEKRKPYYDRYQQIIYDEKPMLYLYSPLTIMAVRNKIRNLHPTALGGVTHNLEELYIQE